LANAPGSGFDARHVLLACDVLAYLHSPGQMLRRMRGEVAQGYGRVPGEETRRHLRVSSPGVSRVQLPESPGPVAQVA
jgi:hypothetical protein